MIDSVVCISNDLTHDADAVSVYTDRVINFLGSVRGLTINYIYQYTDGCSSQYKSRKPFAHIARSKVAINRSFFGSRHGKSSADGISDVTKKAVKRAIVVNRAKINNALEMFNFLDENETRTVDVSQKNHSHSQRQYLYIDSGEISRCESSKNFKTIQGTHSTAALCGRRWQCW